MTMLAGIPGGLGGPVAVLVLLLLLVLLLPLAFVLVLVPGRLAKILVKEGFQGDRLA